MRKIDDVGDELRSMADQKEFRRMSGLLRRLAEDLGTKDAALWARVDLPAVFDADLEVADSGRGARLLYALRSVLILLPVMITWGGIYLAIRAYRSLLAAPPAERTGISGDATFLQLWTTGFGGRTGATLDLVALLDALAIFAVIVVAILATNRHRSAARKEEERRAELHRGLRETLVDVKLALTAAGYDAPDRLSQNLVDLVPLYRETLAQLLQVQKELTSSLEDGRRNVDAMVTATGSLAAAGTSVAGGAAAVSKQVATLEGQVKALDAQITTLVSGVNGLGTQVPELNRGLQEMLAGVQDIGKRLSLVHERQDEVVENLSVLADNPLAAAQSAQRMAALAVHAEEKLREAVAALPQQMDKVGMRLVSAVDRELDERRASTTELTGAGQAALQSVQQVRQAVEQLVLEVGVQRQLPPDVAAAASQIATNLQRSRELVDSLRKAGSPRTRWRALLRRS